MPIEKWKAGPGLRGLCGSGRRPDPRPDPRPDRRVEPQAYAESSDLSLRDPGPGEGDIAIGARLCCLMGEGE